MENQKNGIIIKQLENIINKYHHLDPDVKEAFFSLFSEININKNDFFIKSGVFTSKMGFIKSGLLRVYFTDFNGNDINNVFLLDNDFVIGRLKPNSKSTTNIQALKDSTLLVADIVEVFKLVEKHHALSLLFLKIAAYYFDKNVDREIKLRKYDATHNYAFFLEEYPNLMNEIPHYYVADYLQISSTHLSRIRRFYNG